MQPPSVYDPLAYEKRPARKQAGKSATPMPRPDDPGGYTGYNIWYHKNTGGDRPRGPLTRLRARSRCYLAGDAGRTKASGRRGVPICVFFIKGQCAHGADCVYLHRLLTPEEDAALDRSHDAFGRERFATDREDMGGIGSFSRECKTLYIGGLKQIPGVNPETLVRSHFEEWGEIEYVSVKPGKLVGFVEYKLRSCAEVAKEAMADQSLGYGEILNVRWATEDPNPRNQGKQTKRDDLERMADEALKKGAIHPYTLDMLEPEAKRGRTAEEATGATGPYPNTDQHYNWTAYWQQAQTAYLQSGGDPAQWQQYAAYWQAVRTSQAQAPQAQAMPIKETLPQKASVSTPTVSGVQEAPSAESSSPSKASSDQEKLSKSKEVTEDETATRAAPSSTTEPVTHE